MILIRAHLSLFFHLLFWVGSLDFILLNKVLILLN
uniref:Uncharacterized protein n=1 Tax=Rhizophora mucronata TaxID=61149 RepID=A0A2P2N851_RHIMU